MSVDQPAFEWGCSRATPPPAAARWGVGGGRRRVLPVGRSNKPVGRALGVTWWCFRLRSDSVTRNPPAVVDVGYGRCHEMCSSELGEAAPGYHRVAVMPEGMNRGCTYRTTRRRCGLSTDDLVGVGAGAGAGAGAGGRARSGHPGPSVRPLSSAPLPSAAHPVQRVHRRVPRIRCSVPTADRRPPTVKLRRRIRVGSQH